MVLAFANRRPPRGKDISRFVLLLLALTLLSSLARAQTIEPPGLRAKFEAPPGFTSADSFAGAAGPGGASITIAEFPAAAFEKLKGHLNAQALASNPQAPMQGVTTLTLQRTDDYLAFQGRAEIDGAPVRRALLVIHDSQTTALIAANAPQAQIDGGAIKFEDILASLSRAAFGDMRPAAPSFVFDALGSFKQAGVIMNIATVFNRDGKMPDHKPDPPVASFAVVKMQNAHVGPDPRAQGEAVLRTDHGKVSPDIIVTQSQPTKIGGLDGFAYEAEKGSGADAEYLYAVYLIDGDRFIWLMGSAPAGELATIAELKQVFASFHLVAKK